MTPRDDEHVRPLLGALALGHLEPDEATAVRSHLDACAACREEASQLASVADLLVLADPDRVVAPAEPPREMLDEVLVRIERERVTAARKQRRSVAVRVGAVAAALAALSLVAVLVVEPSPAPAEPEVVAMTASRPGVIGEAVVHEDPESTWVELTTTGLVAGETYGVWLETDAGDRSPLGTFVGVEGDLYISLYSTLPRDRATSIGVSSPDGVTVMEGSLPEAVPA